MATPTLILGANNWAIEEDNILGYALGSSSKQYLPREISFTRGSDATYTDSTGVIRQACWNLLGYSEEFNNAYWSTARGTITPNATISPTGIQDADTLVTLSGQVTTPVVFKTNFITFTGNTAYTLSLFAKVLGDTNVFKIAYVDNSAGGYTGGVATYNLSTQVISITQSPNSSVTASMQNVGNGWYRLILSFVTVATPSYHYIDFGPDSVSTNNTFGIWGAQLVHGTQPLTYLRTTDRLNVPRVDSSTGSKAFLVEPQRTNLALYSNDFTNVVWSKSGATVTPNTTISPDGTQNASTIVFSGVDKYVTQGCFTLGTSATSSVWVKGTSGETITIACGGTDQVFTLNGSWQRLSVSRASTSNIYANINTFLGATARTIYVYGFQAEVGAYPTSYIPTQATTVTRIADSAVRTGISSLIGQTEGVLYCDVNLDVRQSFTYLAIAPNIGAANIYIGIGFNATSIQYEVVNSGVQSQITFLNSSTGRFKIAGAYKENDFVLYVNGSQIGTDTSGTVPTCSEIGLFAYNQATPMRYNQVALFNTRLTNAELAALTTL